MHSDKFKVVDFFCGGGGNSLIFTGSPPCQYYSVINRKKTGSKGRFLTKEKPRFVKYFRPGYVILEK